MKPSSHRLTFALLLTSSFTVFADVKMPSIFGDHMVLQQEVKLPVWGSAAPGEEVTVTVGSETAKSTADASGSWRVDLPPFPNGSAPVTMTVAGKNTLTFQDVLIGDVWVCGGQSNMQFGLAGAHNAATEIPKANDPQLRFFYVHLQIALDPKKDLPGNWVVCTPATAAKFTAVGYFFGKELRSSLNRPIGLIDSCWGGTPAQTWTSIDALEKEPLLKKYVDDYNKLKAAYPQATLDYPAKLASYKEAASKWDKEVGATYNPQLDAWKTEVARDQLAGLPLPPKPQPSVGAPVAPTPPDGTTSTPSTLFNGMIAPMIPFGIKGVIWYQGESNAGASLEYKTLFSDLITDWRQHWGEGNFPFLFVQLSSYKASCWPLIRECQLETLCLPNTGMAVAIDVGDPGGPIHPIDKYDVGLRLSLVAKHVAYGQDLVYSGPIYDSMKVENDSIRLSFTQVGGGLIIGSAPWVASDQKPVPTDKLYGFAIAGADKKWFAADAKIDGNTIVVSSPKVAQPAAVRYAWANAPKCNLYNKEGLPASPFRTDDWTDVLSGGDFLPIK